MLPPRIGALQQLLAKDLNVLAVDVDMVWLKDPFAALEPNLSDFLMTVDSASSADDSPAQKPCAGLIFARATEPTRYCTWREWNQKWAQLCARNGHKRGLGSSFNRGATLWVYAQQLADCACVCVCTMQGFGEELGGIGEGRGPRGAIFNVPSGLGEHSAQLPDTAAGLLPAHAPVSLHLYHAKSLPLVRIPAVHDVRGALLGIQLVVMVQ